MSKTNNLNKPFKGDFFSSEQAVRSYFQKEPVLYNRLSSMKESWRQRLFDYMTGKKTLPMTYDPFFKRIFNVNLHPERLSAFLSAILGKTVTVERILPTEEVMLNGGALLIMDILVRLTDGTLANVEIQKIPYHFPAERMSCYSADLLLREYSRVKNAAEQKFTYQDMKKVYTIIIFEESTAAFHKEELAGEYFHHGKTVFNTGLSLELLQEYYLIALDIFRRQPYTRSDNELNGWLSLLAVENMQEVKTVIQNYPWLEEIYREMAEYLHKPEEVLNMYSEALRILDENTKDLMIDEMREQLENMGQKLTTQTEELANKDKLLRSQADELASKDKLLTDKDAEIARLMQLLEETKGEK